MSFGYHPQSYGLTEVVNRCLETYLWCYTSNQPRKWLQWLSWVKWSYNTSFHTSAQFTPFGIVYGYPPPHLSAYELECTKLELLEQGLLARDRLLSMLMTNLVVSQNHMKVQSDKHKNEEEFAVGDWVYLKLVPY